MSMDFNPSSLWNYKLQQDMLDITAKYVTDIQTHIEDLTMEYLDDVSLERLKEIVDREYERRIQIKRIGN